MRQVNNAGAQEKSWDAATLVHMVNTNCCGPIYLTLELLPLMKPGGCVTMVASVIGEYNRLKEPYCQTVPNATSLAQLQEAASAFVADCPHGGVFFAPYALSKAAMLRATQLLAAEEGNEVAVNAVHPGWCK